MMAKRVDRRQERFDKIASLLLATALFLAIIFLI